MLTEPGNTAIFIVVIPVYGLYQMKFRKEILKEGFHVVGNGSGGRRAEFIPRTRIQHWVDQHAQMRRLGLNIPAPDRHSSDEKPTENTTGSKSNYGFWDALEMADAVDEFGSPIKSLAGYLDVGDSPDADKIGNSVRETSIYAVPEFMDGKGRIWKDVLTHVAVVTNPIEPGQKNFEPMKEGDLAISMSHRLPIQMDMVSVNEIMSGDEANSDDLFDMLEKVAGLSIARGTAPEEMTKALLNALRQKQLSESASQGGTLLTPPKNSQTSEVPVVMSNNQPAIVAEPIQMNQPVTPIVVPAEATVMSQQHAGMLEYLTGNSKQSLNQRLDGLIKRGLIKGDDVVKSFKDQINTVQMSFDASNKPVKSAVEMAIDTLELIKIPMPTDRPIVAMAQQDEANFVIQQHDNNFISGDNMDEKDLDDTVAAMFSQLN